jgi:hypothetical protein
MILDITDYKQKGIRLNRAIEQAVKDSPELPELLFMTQDQYNNIAHKNALYQPLEENQHHQLYMTSENVMEIRIQDEA